MYKKLIGVAVLFLLIAGIFITIRFLSGDEDTWICENGSWIRHGNPSDPMPISGCGSKDVKEETEKNVLSEDKKDGSEKPVGIANPASVFCIENDGKLEIRKDEIGNETGWCIFANGKECEEWSFFRGECSVQYLNKDGDTKG